MKRLILSLALLAALAGLGAWNTSRIDDSCQRTCALLRQAQERGESDDWTGAEALIRAAWAEWNQRSTYLYTVLRHDYTDEIYTEFHELIELIEKPSTTEIVSITVPGILLPGATVASQ